MNISDCDVRDPLLAKPQFVVTLQEILDNLKTRRYFLSYLEGSNRHVLAAFWIDVHNLQQCGLQILAEQSSAESASDQQDGNKSVNKCSSNSNSESHNVLDDRPETTNDTYNNFASKSDNGNRGNASDSREAISAADVSNANVNLSNSYYCDKYLENESSNSNNEYREFKSNRVQTQKLQISECDAGNTIISENKFDSLSPHSEEIPTNGNVSQNNKKFSLSGDILQHLIKEVWRIFERYIAVDSDFKCPISERTKKSVTNKINKLHVDFDPYCFQEAQQEAFLLLEGEVSGFLSSDHHLRHQLDLLSYSSPALPDILHSQVAFPYFMEFLEQEGAQSLLEFWMVATNFRDLLTSVPNPNKSDTASTNNIRNQDDAMVVYDKFISLQASHRLGFSDELRCYFEGNICQEQGPDSSCFDVALRIVMYVLQTHFMPSYLRSNMYDCYVSDLLTSVKNTTGGRQRTVSGSTCSSDVSSSTTATTTNNTLLAVDSSSVAGNSSNKSSSLLPATTNMRIDSRLISDPDSLWRRRRAGGLSFGSINCFGRFESSLKLEVQGGSNGPQQSDNKIARTLRRLANREDDKVKLEQAYSVAASIVSDVTRVTLDARNSPTSPYHPANSFDLSNLRHPQHPLNTSNSRCGSSSRPLSGYITDDPPLLYSQYFKSPALHESSVSLASSSTSDLPSSAHPSPSKSVTSLPKSSSNYNFSEITDSIFGSGSHGLAHSYSLASFDLATDVDAHFPP